MKTPKENNIERAAKIFLGLIGLAASSMGFFVALTVLVPALPGVGPTFIAMSAAYFGMSALMLIDGLPDRQDKPITPTK